MSQHDFNIANQTASAFRADLNNALTALASLSSGSTAPSSTFANMLWYDTAANLLKMRNEANSAWVSIGYLDQGAGAFRILDDTQVTNTSGAQVGLLGGQATSAWQAGTGTLESLVSPANVKSAINALSQFTVSYSSAEQTVAAGGGGTLTHGLSAMPTLIKPYWVCKVAEHGYSVGQYVDASNVISTWTSGTAYSVGFTIAANSTSISYRFGTTQPIGLLNLSTGASAFGTTSSWRLVVRAWL